MLGRWAQKTLIFFFEKNICFWFFIFFCPAGNFFFEKKSKNLWPLKFSVWVADGEILTNIKFQGSRVDIKIFMRGSKLKIWKKPLSHTPQQLSPFCKFALIWGCLFRLQPYMLSRPRRTTTLKTIVFWEKIACGAIDITTKIECEFWPATMSGGGSSMIPFPV